MEVLSNAEVGVSTARTEAAGWEGRIGTVS